MKMQRKQFLLAVAVGTASLLGLDAAAQMAAPTLTQAEVKQIVASPDRSAADRTNDQRRKPEEMLVFIGIKPGITALDISAAGGYTTELLARAIGPTGQVYGQSRPRDPNRPSAPPPVDEGNASPSAAAPAGAMTAAPAMAMSAAPKPSPVALADRDKALKAGGKAAPITAVVQPFESPVPPQLATGGVDLVTLMFNYHDLGWMGVDRTAMNKAVFQALKSGGVYVIADHAGRPGTGISESGTLHRIEKAFLQKEVEAAGFKLAAEGTFLANPNDPKDKNTPDPAQPKDEFVVKFVKP